MGGKLSHELEESKRSGGTALLVSNKRLFKTRKTQKWPKALEKLSKALPHVRIFVFKHCEIDVVPPQIAALFPKLTLVNLEGNLITELPAELAQLAGTLTGLVLANNALTRLPEVISTLTSLMHLSLSNNPMKWDKTMQLPCSLEQLQISNTIDNESDGASIVEKLVAYLTRLTTLEAERNNLGRFPCTLPPSLTALHLSNNPISRDLGSSPAVPVLPKLRVLLLQNTCLSVLPPIADHCCALTKLDISQNSLASLPSDFSRLTALEVLKLSSNQFAELPRVICYLPLLKKLDLSNNRLTSLPHEISRLTSLVALTADHNNIGRQSATFSPTSSEPVIPTYSSGTIPYGGLPEELCQLPHLSVLLLDYNEISDVPPTLLTSLFTRIRTLSLDHNPITARVYSTLSGRSSPSSGLGLSGPISRSTSSLASSTNASPPYPRSKSRQRSNTERLRTPPDPNASTRSVFGSMRLPASPASTSFHQRSRSASVVDYAGGDASPPQAFSPSSVSEDRLGSRAHPLYGEPAKQQSVFRRTLRSITSLFHHHGNGSAAPASPSMPTADAAPPAADGTIGRRRAATIASAVDIPPPLPSFESLIDSLELSPEQRAEIMKLPEEAKSALLTAAAARRSPTTAGGTAAGSPGGSSVNALLLAPGSRNTAEATPSTGRTAAEYMAMFTEGIPALDELVALRVNLTSREGAWVSEFTSKGGISALIGSLFLVATRKHKTTEDHPLILEFLRCVRLLMRVRWRELFSEPNAISIAVLAGLDSPLLRTRELILGFLTDVMSIRGAGRTVVAEALTYFHRMRKVPPEREYRAVVECITMEPTVDVDTSERTAIVPLRTLALRFINAYVDSVDDPESRFDLRARLLGRAGLRDAIEALKRGGDVVDIADIRDAVEVFEDNFADDVEAIAARLGRRAVIDKLCAAGCGGALEGVESQTLMASSNIMIVLVAPPECANDNSSGAIHNATAPSEPPPRQLIVPYSVDVDTVADVIGRIRSKLVAQTSGMEPFYEQFGLFVPPQTPGNVAGMRKSIIPGTAGAAAAAGYARRGGMWLDDLGRPIREYPTVAAETEVFVEFRRRPIQLAVQLQFASGRVDVVVATIDTQATVAEAVAEVLMQSSQAFSGKSAKMIALAAEELGLVFVDTATWMDESDRIEAYLSELESRGFAGVALRSRPRSVKIRFVDAGDGSDVTIATVAMAFELGTIIADMCSAVARTLLGAAVAKDDGRHGDYGLTFDTNEPTEFFDERKCLRDYVVAMTTPHSGTASPSGTPKPDVGQISLKFLQRPQRTAVHIYNTDDVTAQDENADATHVDVDIYYSRPAAEALATICRTAQLPLPSNAGRSKAAGVAAGLYSLAYVLVPEKEDAPVALGDETVEVELDPMRSLRDQSVPRNATLVVRPRPTPQGFDMSTTSLVEGMSTMSTFNLSDSTVLAGSTTSTGSDGGIPRKPSAGIVIPRLLLSDKASTAAAASPLPTPIRRARRRSLWAGSDASVATASSTPSTKVTVGIASNSTAVVVAVADTKSAAPTEVTILYDDPIRRIGVRAGTLERLIEHMTSPEGYDSEFTETFLTTWPSFVDADTLLAALFARYAEAGGNSANPSVDAMRNVKLRVFDVLQMLMERGCHGNEWTESHIQKVAEFAENMKREAGNDQSERAAVAQRLLASVAALRQSTTSTLNPRRRSMRLPATEPLPEPRIPRILASGDSLTFMDIDELEMARQLTLRLFSIFSEIRPAELLSCHKPSAQSTFGATSAIQRMIKMFNAVATWVASTIVSTKQLRSRTVVMERFIGLAAALRSLNNFHLLTAVISGLNNSAVSRLKFTRGRLSKKSRRTLAELEALMSMEGSYKAYRAAISAVKPPAIPYLGVYLTDLVFIDDGNADTVGGLINFTKRRLMMTVVTIVQRLQRHPYNLASVEEIDSFLGSVLMATVYLTDKELYEQSLVVEPRGASRLDIT